MHCRFRPVLHPRLSVKIDATVQRIRGERAAVPNSSTYLVSASSQMEIDMTHQDCVAEWYCLPLTHGLPEPCEPMQNQPTTVNNYYYNVDSHDTSRTTVTNTYT